MCIRDLRADEVETGRYWGLLISQPSLVSELQAMETFLINKLDSHPEKQHLRLTFGLHTHAPTNAAKHTNMNTGKHRARINERMINPWHVPNL